MIEIIDLDIDKNKYTEAVVGLGNFDGIHIGHREIMNKVLEVSKEKGIVSSVLLFKQHTNEIFPKMPRMYLSDLQDKIDILDKIGIQRVYLINFTMEFAQLTNEEFILDLIRDRMNARTLVCGVDYTYGKFAKGTIKELYEYQNNSWINLYVVDPKMYDDRKVSSTIIRNLILSGDLKEATKLLGNYYSVRGIVEHGFKRGSTELGFPTANLKFDFPYIMPMESVYLTRNLIDGKLYFSLTSIGTNPTFMDSEEVKFEVFILDFDGDLYGKEIKVEFIEKLRGQIKFNNGEDLVKQMKQDLENARQIISNI